MISSCLHSVDLTCLQSSCSALDLVTSRAAAVGFQQLAQPRMWRGDTGTADCAGRARGGDAHSGANSSWCVSVTILSLVGAVADTGILTGEVPGAAQLSRSLLVFWAFFGVAAVSVSGEGTAPLHVGSLEATVTAVSARGFLAQVYKRSLLCLSECLVGPGSLHSRLSVLPASWLATSPVWDRARDGLSRSAAPVARQQRSLSSSRSTRTSLAFGGTRL